MEGAGHAVEGDRDSGFFEHVRGDRESELGIGVEVCNFDIDVVNVETFFSLRRQVVDRRFDLRDVDARVVRDAPP